MSQTKQDYKMENVDTYLLISNQLRMRYKYKKNIFEIEPLFGYRNIHV